MSRTCRRLLLPLVLTLASQARTPTGAIEGAVTDPSGAVVPGAAVSVAEQATGRTIGVTTNSVGFYPQSAARCV